MKRNIKLLVIILGTMGWLTGAASSGLAQQLSPVFPPNGATIKFQDLVTRGFEWTAPPAAKRFQIRLFGPDPFLSQVPFESTSSPIKVQSYLERYFPEGAVFQWHVEIVDENKNILQTSEQFEFTISNITTLIPTPTPVVWPTPSGDIDGSAKVDARDLFILASSWIKSDGSLRPADLNRDSVIDRKDLLFYMDRFGKPGDPPPPMAPVGIPRDVRFSPDFQVTIAETPQLEILWSIPAYPQTGGIVYDILIVPPYGSNMEYRGIETNSLKPFQGMTTRIGPYMVFIQARLNGVGLSDIASGQFEIVYFKTPQPTPTPVPQTANISGDKQINALDVASFLLTFNTYKGHVKFNSAADLYTDAKIDRKDLLLFQQYYKDRERGLSAPVWKTAEVPVIVAGIPESYNLVELLPPYELPVGQTNAKLGMAEAFFTRFSFSPVSGAIDYFVSIHYVNNNNRLDFFTGGETAFTEKLIPLGADEIIEIDVWAAGDGLQLGEKSETLRVLIPPS